MLNERISVIWTLPAALQLIMPRALRRCWNEKLLLFVLSLQVVWAENKPSHGHWRLAVHRWILRQELHRLSWHLLTPETPGVSDSVRFAAASQICGVVTLRPSLVLVLEKLFSVNQIICSRLWTNSWRRDVTFLELTDHRCWHLHYLTWRYVLLTIRGRYLWKGAAAGHYRK